MLIKYDIWYPDSFNKSQRLPFDKTSEINETMKLMKEYFYLHNNDENPSNHENNHLLLLKEN